MVAFLGQSRRAKALIFGATVIVAGGFLLMRLEIPTYAQGARFNMCLQFLVFCLRWHS